MISFSFQMNLKSHFSIYGKSNMNLVIIVISIFIFHVNIHSVRGKKYQFFKFLSIFLCFYLVWLSFIYVFLVKDARVLKYGITSGQLPGDMMRDYEFWP